MSISQEIQHPRRAVALSRFRATLRRTRLVAICSSLGSILVFAGGGYLLDLALDKKYFWTIIGLVIAFVVMNIVTVYFSHRVVNQERTRADA